MTEALPGAKDRFWRYHEGLFLPSPISDHLVEMSHYQPKLHVVLHQPEAKLWLVRPLGFQVDDYHLRRAGMDYWQHLEWETVDDWEALEEMLAPGRTWFFTKKAEQNYLDAEFQPGDALVFGSESQGLPGSILAKYAEKTLRISTRPQVRSLNLSNSVAVATYEALRQWATP